MRKESSRINPNNFRIADLTTYQVGTMQSTANRALKKLGDNILQNYGITTVQWHIIGAISEYGLSGARISDIAQQIDTTLAFLTNNVNLLEAKGILLRSADKNDGRAKKVVVNPPFHAKIEEIETQLRQQLRQSLYSKVSPEELHTYLKVLAKFTEFMS